MAERVRRAPSGSRSRRWGRRRRLADLPPAAADGASTTTPGPGPPRSPRGRARRRLPRSTSPRSWSASTPPAGCPPRSRGWSALEVRPRRLVAIDNGSSDSTRTLLEQARAEGLLDAVYTGKRTYGFGQAVQSALRQDRPSDGPRTEAPGPTLTSSEHAGPAARPPLALAAARRRRPRARRPLPAAGPRGHRARPSTSPAPSCCCPSAGTAATSSARSASRISGTGRRELLLDRGEIDQGQRDQPAERLGVSTCGMLVRTAVWRDLDGLDPAVPVFRDGVEFGWRAHLNGYRVVTTPDAEMTHRQVGRAGLRPRGLTGRHPGTLDRLLGMTVVAGHAPARSLPAGLAAARAQLPAARAVGYLLGKAPGRVARRAGRALVLRRAPRPAPRAAQPDRLDRPGSRHRRGRPLAPAAVVVEPAGRRRGAQRRRSPSATSRSPARSTPPRSTS